MAKQFVLIDDDSDDSELFLEALTKVDPHTKCQRFTHGRQALSHMLHNDTVLPDIIFLDINLPIMSGWEILAELKKAEALKGIPVIMYSTSSSPRDKEIANELGALCFFTKPDSYKILINMLEIVLVHLKNNSIGQICAAVKKSLN